MKTFKMSWSTPTGKVPDYESIEGAEIRQVRTEFAAEIQAETQDEALEKLRTSFPSTTIGLKCVEN